MRSLGADSRRSTQATNDRRTEIQTDIQTEIVTIQRHAHAGRARATALAVGTRSS